ncbi:TssQ family T6SS-associated lipoprotein [Undibacterium sp. Jales W-56]|uniref:TssQ family T6SS-associated lipoprotein n=1 Tax=Undibacterium sp. Jales W-56 TaxID=2897325 RepID=UPI0021CE20CB|nr:TssQ family T6SS-associated lipoprotein [Undibacterium sp. Jales W-56]MCU6432469.1 TssQ family T6SS-associated lipoprotein [Undibacterium sp. Jales W-56]
MATDFKQSSPHASPPNRQEIRWANTPTGQRKTSLSAMASTIGLIVILAGCAAPETQVGLSDLSARPGEKALLSGIRSYEDAQYTEAEKSLTLALSSGFTVKKDAALAHKYLAFIFCTSARIEACKQAFRSARMADPSFELNKSEVGHPQWGPVYKQVMAE